MLARIPKKRDDQFEGKQSGYIASPSVDWALIIGAPVMAVALVQAFSQIQWLDTSFELLGVEQLPAPLLIIVITHAHLFAVFFRSHGNQKIFVRHRAAFLVVPPALLAGFVVSDWAIISGLVVAVFWATYHIGMQSFGLGRIYDRLAGNPPEAARRLDYLLHQVINLGPFLAGMALIPTLSSLERFRAVGWDEPSQLTRAYGDLHGVFSLPLLVAGVSFLTYYAFSIHQLCKQGYVLSRQKLALLLTTGAVSVLAWGFMTPWKAFFVVNFFHSIQYLALVWWSEKVNLARLLRLAPGGRGRVLAFGVFMAATLGFGFAYNQYGTDYEQGRWAAAAALTVALLHYWYDGFIWSVRRSEI